MIPGSFASNLFPVASSGGYAVDNSAVFNKADSEYFAADSGFGTPSNADIGTLSFWFKRANLGDSNLRLFTHGSGGSVQIQAYLTSSNTLVVGNGTEVTTTQVFRDPHAWYHLVVRVDTSQGSSADRVRLYLNGSQITSFSASSYPSQNGNVFTSTGWRIGSWTGSTSHTFDGYMSEVVYCDGQSLAPTDFGETDDNGVWRPVDPSGNTFGNNGFYLPFTDSGQLGGDNQSGSITSLTLSGEWNGDTGDFSSLDRDIIAIGGNQGAIRTNDTFTGDFAVEFDWRAGANPAYLGVYEISEDGTFSSGSSDGGLGSMTNSFYLFFTSSNNVNAVKGSSTEASAIFQVVYGNVETIKFERSGSQFKVYEDGVLRHTFTGTSSSEVRLLVGQSSSSMDWENFRWTNGSTTIGNPFLPVNSPTQSSDSPTKNFATLSSLMENTGKVTLSEGGLKTTSSTSGGDVGRVCASIAMPTSGKYYWETTVDTIGVTPSLGFTSTKDVGYKIDGDSAFISVYINGASGGSNGKNYYGSDLPSTGTGSYGNMTVPWTNGMVIGTAYDADNELCWFSQNGTWIDGNGTDNSATVLTEIQNGTAGSEAFSAAVGGIGRDDLLWQVTSRSVSSFVYTQNFGASAFSYSAPSGFGLLNAATIAENMSPTIEDGSAYIQSSLWSGNSSSQTVSQTGNSTFTPDWVWIKDRNFGNGGNVFDSVRGSNKGQATFDSGIEDTNTDGVTFASGSIAFTGAGNTGDINNSGRTYVGWQWLAGNGTVANEVGSLNSTVSANPTAGFSIVSYTGNGGSGGAQTVGHGLGAKPNMIMIKNRDTTDSWVVYHDAVGFNAITLDTDAARITAGASIYWNDTAHTSTIFNVNTSPGVNGNTNSMIAYCFADVPGYSKFGSYIGNASTDGPFVGLGFRPAFVMIKAITQTESWWIGDDVRDGYNQGNRPMLTADDTAVEDNGWSGNAPYDALSNGFKIRRTGGAFNTSGGVGYLYMAFAAHPFAGTTPGTAR